VSYITNLTIKTLIRLLRRPIMVKEPLWSSRTIIGWQVIVKENLKSTQ